MVELLDSDITLQGIRLTSNGHLLSGLSSPGHGRMRRGFQCTLI